VSQVGAGVGEGVRVGVGPGERSGGGVVVGVGVGVGESAARHVPPQSPGKVAEEDKHSRRKREGVLIQLIQINKSHI